MMGVTTQGCNVQKQMSTLLLCSDSTRRVKEEGEELNYSTESMDDFYFFL